jgi:hypothetical protein
MMIHLIIDWKGRGRNLQSVPRNASQKCYHLEYGLITERVEKDVEGSGHGIICSTIPAFTRREWGKPRKGLRVDGLRDESWTGNLSNRKAGLCPLDRDVLSFLRPYNTLRLAFRLLAWMLLLQWNEIWWSSRCCFQKSSSCNLCFCP